MDSLESARQAKADADASLKASNEQVAAVEAKLQKLQDKFMEASGCWCHPLYCKLVACSSQHVKVFNCTSHPSSAC